ncbi:hypothetical protein BJY04DRAFT_55805 [Aspergillus karnatakaensis]|uniref:uncharacterized protein n=1 Tax=Aspergillus karnatakaensis TaxID=1810916 RepID=UPI003CCD11FF
MTTVDGSESAETRGRSQLLLSADWPSIYLPYCFTTAPSLPIHFYGRFWKRSRMAGCYRIPPPYELLSVMREANLCRVSFPVLINPPGRVDGDDPGFCPRNQDQLGPPLLYYDDAHLRSLRSE